MIVVFAYGGAPSFETPSTQLSRQEILVMHCAIKQDARDEGFPEQPKDSLSSIIYRATKQKKALRAHIGRASNLFLTKAENRLNSVYLYDTAGGKMKKIEVSSLCQDTGIE